ncbi:MAG TPA: Crp/Fnr family transcriptional regulator [Spirochaetota bacterium]|nr:Crp/Fnr family transcriptional regulator [Spirochaetota bacterium]HPJ40296.1 Crp/Fnr family transcriptional regulator [Spirochaetota bacterium]
MDSANIVELIKTTGINIDDTFCRKQVRARDILLHAGETARLLYFVIAGCLRMYYVKEDGSEITSQFFIENQGVSSFESAFTNTPSRAFIDAIEDSTVYYIEVEELKKIISKNDIIKEFFNEYIKQRLITYMNVHASFILDSPEQRYIRLINEHPELITRIPQQYIATYLGITPVSLSRIRKRLKELRRDCPAKGL